MKKIIIIGFCLMFQLSVVSISHAGWFDDVVDWVENAKDDVVDWVDGAKDDVSLWFENADKDIVDWFKNANEDTLNWFKTADKDVADWFKTAGSDTKIFLDFVQEVTHCVGYSSSGSIPFKIPDNLASTTGQFSVLTYNIHGFPEFIQGISEAEMRRVSALIESWDIDIAGIQEDWVTHEELISQLTTSTYPYRTNHYCGTPVTFGDGLATFSGFAFDPDASVRYQFNACDGTLMEFIKGEINSPDCATEKGFSMSRIYIANDLIVDFYTLHHNTGGNYGVNSINMEQVAEYMAANSSGNVIVLTGDFNMGSNDRVMEDFANNNGFTFVCEELGVGCGIDMILYKGTNQYKLSAVSQEKLDGENLSDHDPRKAVLQWEKNPVNLALGKETMQSSTGWDGVSSRAVDGNMDGNYSGANSVTHTQNDLNAWWQVDLGVSSDIFEIVINNRTDCCADRLSNFYVFVSNSSMHDKTLGELMADPLVDFSFYGGAVDGVASLPVSAPGRFVKIQLEGQNHLSLAEVRILGNEGIKQVTNLELSLLGAHGNYFVAEGNGGRTVNADRSAIGAWERFILTGIASYSNCVVDGDPVNIRTGGGMYFSAQSNGNLDADRVAARSWETFTLINHSDSVGCLEDGDIISLKSYHNNYVVAESNGRANANRSAIGPWEKIQVIFN
ncbi:MAG: hypothetical protein GY710_08225 [Desulfobacteraceae bacterium]|nr:hypothetical protein [Desulfobacteraceae bacterium]